MVDVYDLQNGCVVGPVLIVPMLALSVYGMGFGAVIEPLMQFLMALSYLRYGVTAYCNALYGFDRGFLSCDLEETNYCHYRDPVLLIKDLGLKGTSYLGQLSGLIVFLIFFRVTAFVALRLRLTAEFSNKLLNYAAKVFRTK